MMSLSKEWALLSRAMYGQDFIDELADFLKKQKVKIILECGCGDGNVLQGLAKKGFRGLGIDGDSEMIKMANQEHNHPNISYLTLNWLDLERISGQYDCVLCRGNSLSYVLNWNKSKKLSKEEVTGAIKRSVGLMLRKLKPHCLLYVDTVKQEDIEEGSREFEITYPNISMRAKIEYDLKRRIRRTSGEGRLYGEEFKGVGESFFITPNELEELIKEFNPSRVWHPVIQNEINYHVVCAKK